MAASVLARVYMGVMVLMLCQLSLEFLRKIQCAMGPVGETVRFPGQPAEELAEALQVIVAGDVLSLPGA
jgi:hypothetical protein